MRHPTVLVFVEFPEPKFPTDGFLDDLAYPDAELVGFYHIDEDEDVDEVRTRHKEEFEEELQEQVERFEQRGVRTEVDLLFNHDRVEARQRIAESDDVDAVLIPGGAHTLGRVLIACRDLRNAENKAATVLNVVDRDALIATDLVHVADPDEPEAETEGERLLREMASVLTDEGLSSVEIGRDVRTGSDVAFELNRAARGYDLVVLGETQQDLGDEVFGPVGEYLVDECDVPVLIVR